MNKRIREHIIHSLSLTILAAWLFTSCDMHVYSSSFANEQLEKEYSLYDIYTDEYGNQGIVLYAEHGKKQSRMLVLSLDETYLPWGPAEEKVFLGDSIPTYPLAESMRFGVFMLQCVSERGIENYPAMAWCNKKNHDRLPYTGSWRLPTVYEWAYIVGDNGEYVSYINDVLSKYNSPLIRIDNNSYYWMCEEDYPNYIRLKEYDTDYDPYNRAAAVTADLLFRTDKDYWSKKTYHYVRALKHVEY